MSSRKWKAVKVRDIFDLRKFFGHRFDLRMSAKLAELGYEIETKLKPDGTGGMKYHTWDIKAAPGHEKGWQSVNARTAAAQGNRGEGEGDRRGDEGARSRTHRTPSAAVARNKLAATTRRPSAKT